jgi:tRNA (Thr-GGU) A37 N-methylase
MTKYIIVDIISKEFFKDADGNVKIFEDYDDALSHCGIYEFENAWICELKHNHIEE